jgi:hypothetical protein
MTGDLLMAALGVGCVLLFLAFARLLKHDD